MRPCIAATVQGFLPEFVRLRRVPRIATLDLADTRAVPEGVVIGWGRGQLQTTTSWAANCCVPSGADRECLESHEWMVIPAICQALYHSDCGWEGTYPCARPPDYDPDDADAETHPLSWEDLVFLLGRVIEGHEIGFECMLARLDGRLHWPISLQEWFIEHVDALWGGGLNQMHTVYAM